MKKQILALFLVGAMIFGSASAIFAEKSADNVVAAINDGQENDSLPFTDVPEGSWYYDYVKSVREQGLMTGLDDTTFGPASELVRAQFAVIIYRMEGSPEVDSSENPFPDNTEDWYKNAVIWANKEGIITGYSDSGMFGPNDAVTREQMAALMYRYAAYKGYDIADQTDIHRFPDAGDVQEFAKKAISWTVKVGIISGDNGKLNPQGSANRAVGATIIDRFVKKMTREVFVSPEWVKSVIDGELPASENYLVANVDWYGRTTYDEGHLPGAVYMTSNEVEYTDWEPWPEEGDIGDGLDDLTGKPYDVYNLYNLRTPEELAAFLKKFGIESDTTLILYSSNTSIDSSVSRVAMGCLYAGVENVKIMDGGLELWKEQELPLTTEETLPVAGDDSYDFGAEIPAHPEYIMSIEDVQENLENNPDFRLVSIRRREEFTGEISGYKYIPKTGEPKGAIWGRNSDAYIEEDGTVVGIDVVESILAEANSSLDNELSFYCGTGWRATIPFFICYQEGMDNVTLYDGGWYQWQLSDPEEYPIQQITPEEAAANVLK